MIGTKFKVLNSICLERLRKTTKILRQNVRAVASDFKAGYCRGVLTTGLQLAAYSLHGVISQMLRLTKKHKTETEGKKRTENYQYPGTDIKRMRLLSRTSRPVNLYLSNIL